ncbi:PAS domain-containing protein [Streptomyces sp. NPDC002935]|uniref:PAS domain-containing protein n=1 Tax=Streptomyces sp. NPDC002935 TaxID=3154545 RepID=UPI0033A51E6A
MAQTDEFGEELADFVRRVSELRAARSVPAENLATVLDAAIFELDHMAEQLWPAYQRLSAAGPSGIGSVDRQEQQLLKALFQRVPVPVVLLDRETVVRRMNLAATSFTGVRAGYATGRPLTGFLAHADRAAFRSQAAAVARGEGDRGLTVHLQQEPSVPVRATLTALRPSGEPRTAVLVVLQPVDEGNPSDSRGSSERGAPGWTVPSLSASTRHAALMDLVDAMTTALLGAPDGDRAAVLERAAGVLHGRFADWVVADADADATGGTGAGAAAGAGAGRLSRTTVLGPPGCGEEVAAVAAQDPAACPLVAEAVSGGSTALQVRSGDPGAFGHDASGAPVLVRADVTSLLCVPLPGASGSVHGVLTLFRSGGRLAFSMAEAQAMDMMSRHIALRLARSD